MWTPGDGVVPYTRVSSTMDGKTEAREESQILHLIKILLPRIDRNPLSIDLSTFR